jgi:hypothetical protein
MTVCARASPRLASRRPGTDPVAQDANDTEIYALPGTEICFVRFLDGRADLCRSSGTRSQPCFGRQGSSLDQAMNQPVSGSPVVTHLGALIALGTLLAINLASMSKFFFRWW